MVILGIDPGLNVTGYGLLARGPKVVEAGVLRGLPEKGKAPLASRLRHLYDSIVELLDQFRPSAMVVEQLFAHYEHPRTAIMMGHARGVILLAGGQRGIPVRSYAATTIKKTISGSGRASKRQIQLVVQRELGLAVVPEPSDVADALAVALCEYHRARPA
jgi:crossover junction endodeoxyribonuclease RuvC